MSVRSCRVSNLLIWTCVASCDEFLYIWEALVASFPNLSLDSCIGNRGEERLGKFALTYPNSQGGSLCISFAFLAFGVVVCCVKSVWPILVIGLTDFGNWSDRFVPSVGTCSGGVCICAGELLYALVVCALSLSLFLTRLCQAVALA
jgi:hypothetical protein